VQLRLHLQRHHHLPVQSGDRLVPLRNDEGWLLHHLHQRRQEVRHHAAGLLRLSGRLLLRAGLLLLHFVQQHAVLLRQVLTQSADWLVSDLLTALSLAAQGCLFAPWDGSPDPSGPIERHRSIERIAGSRYRTDRETRPTSESHLPQHAGQRAEAGRKRRVRLLEVERGFVQAAGQRVRLGR